MASKLLPTKSELAAAKRAGRYGDKDLVHVNPQEEHMLLAAGGSGSVNPRTGLREFYSDSANEHSRATTGGNMADHSRPGGAGTQGGGGNASAGATGLRGPLGPTGDAGFTNAKLGVGSDFQGALSDFANNYTHDAPSRVAKFLTGFGLRQPDPDVPSTFAHGLAHTGVDPLGAALGIGGFFNPVVGAASKLYSLGKLVTGYPGPEVTLGDAKPGDPTAGPAQGFDYSGGPGPQGRYGQGVSAPAGPMGLGNPTQGGNGGSLLPPLPGAGGGGAPAMAPTPSIPGSPVAPGSGLLPPINVPSAYRPVWGNYGANLPSYTYRG